MKNIPDLDYVGCYTDTSDRDLPYVAYSKISDLTVEKCVSACNQKVRMVLRCSYIVVFIGKSMY